MELSEIIRTRKSIRKYKPTPVEEALLQEILEAGRLAPTAGNGQNWYCLVVRNAEVLRRLGEACNNQHWAGEAPVNLVICGTNNRTMPCGQYINPIDCSIVTTQMMLKATELGLGSCWLGAFFTDQVKEVLQIPEEDTVIAVMPIGYADIDPEARPRKESAEFFRFID